MSGRGWRAKIAAFLWASRSRAAWPVRRAQTRPRTTCSIAWAVMAPSEGVPGKIPPLAHSLGRFMRMPAGRNYVLRVPGAANSALSDATIGGGAELARPGIQFRRAHPDVPMFTAAEVTALRHSPLASVLATRHEVVRDLPLPDLRPRRLLIERLLTKIAKIPCAASLPRIPRSHQIRAAHHIAAGEHFRFVVWNRRGAAADTRTRPLACNAICCRTNQSGDSAEIRTQR